MEIRVIKDPPSQLNGKFHQLFFLFLKLFLRGLSKCLMPDYARRGRTSTPSMRKGCDEGEKTGGKKEKKKRLMKIVATTSFASSLPPERQPLERRMLAAIL